MRGKIRIEESGKIKVGVKVQILRESDKIEHQTKIHLGKRLHIMYWQVVPVIFEGYACRDCQGLATRLEGRTRERYDQRRETYTTPMSFIDITDEVRFGEWTQARVDVKKESKQNE